jgi:colicin import membrane protein
MTQSAHRIKGKASAGANSAGTSAAYCVVLSALLHLALMAGLMFVPDLAPAKRITPSVVSVSLVSLPAAGADASPAPVPAAKKPAEPRPVEKQLSPSPKATEKVAVPAAKLKPKTSLKHRTFTSSKVVKSAVDRIEKELDDSRPPSLEKTLERLKREVADDGEKPRGTSTPSQGEATAGLAGSGGTQLSAGEIADGIRIYQAEISYQIQKKWAFSEQLAGSDKNLEVLIGIRIAPDGRIVDTWFDQRSGNRHLDESAHRAVMKASPLPPLPRDLFAGDYTVGLRFGPEGIKR